MKVTKENETELPIFPDHESLKNLIGEESILIFTVDGRMHYIKPKIDIGRELTEEQAFSHLLPVAIMKRFKDDPEWMKELARYTAKIVVDAAREMEEKCQKQ